MARHLLFKQDALDYIAHLASISEESIDLIVTDPPYESMEKHRKIGTTTRLKKEWFDIFPNKNFPELFRLAFKVLKKNSHLYMFCDQETMFTVKPMAEEAGFKFWKPIVWDKMRMGMGYHYRAQYELILFFEKGKRKLNHLGIPDILRYPRIYKGSYPTEKPVEVSSILIEQSSEKGDWILDPFMGSGSVGVAALNTGRQFIGCDTSDKALEIARARLEGLAK